MTILGLDLGRKKTGVALSHGVVAEGIATLKFDENKIGEFITELNKIIDEQGVELIVIGLPLGKDQKQTKQSLWTKDQGKIIKEETGKEVVFTEESYSSAQAKGEQGDIDQQSARIILEQYLNETRSSALQ